MKIEFKKVGFNKKEITISDENLLLEGDLSRDDSRLVDFDARLSGKVKVECIRCGEEFEVEVDEKLDLKLCDGVYRGSEKEVDVIEFYEGVIDMDELLRSEKTSITLDYHLCPKCKEGEKNGSS